MINVMTIVADTVDGKSIRDPKRGLPRYVAPSNPEMLLVACCIAGMAKSLEPQLWVFYPPHAAPFGAGWATARHLSSIAGVLLVIMVIGGGMIGDFYGRRRFLLLGLALTIFANLLAIVSPSSLWHMVLHVFTILAAAVVLPLSLAPLYLHFRGRKRLIAFAWYMLATTAAAVLASTLADLGMGFFGWRGAYYLPLLTAVVAAFLVYRTLPESYVRGERHFDAAVYAGWTLVILAVLFGIVQWGLVGERLAALIIVCSVACGLGLALIIWWNANTPGSLFHNSTIRVRDMTMLIMLGVIVQLVLMSFVQSTYRYFDVVKGFTLIQRSLALLPILIGMIVATRLVGKMWRLYEVRRLIALGLLLTGASVGLMAIRPDIMPYVIQILPLTLFGFAYLSTKTVWTNGLFQSMIDDYTGLNAGINSATLMIGGALGSVLAGQLVVVFGQRDFQDRLAGFGLPAQIRQLFTVLTQISERDFLAQILDPTLLGEVVWDAYVASYALAYGRTLWIVVGIALIGATAVWIGLRRSNIRFTAEEVAVDLEASVFEDVSDSF
jgi:MFS family permease